MKVVLPFSRFQKLKMAKDIILLAGISFFVFVSVPVSVMGDESVFEYFFTPKKTQILEIDDNCLRLGSCRAEIASGAQLRLEMPSQVSITEPFDVAVMVGGVLTERVTVMFEGVDHSHGLLPQQMKTTDGEKYVASGLLSYCGYAKMDWVAWVTVHTERVIYKAPFLFQSIDTGQGVSAV